jgi:hypothetical protein
MKHTSKSFLRPKNIFQPIKIEKMSFYVSFVPPSLSLTSLCRDPCSFRRASWVEHMTSRFKLTEGGPPGPLGACISPYSSSTVELEYRYGHLGPRQAHHCAFRCSPQSFHEHSGDWGPPCRSLDLAGLCSFGRTAVDCPTSDDRERGPPT